MTVSTRPMAGKAISAEDQHLLAQILWITTFAILTAVGARFEIERYPVPYTLQTLMVLLAGAFLGPRNGAISQLLYIGAGAMGAPVFASGAFGIARLIGPTGGYLIAFPIAAALVGWMVRKNRALPWVVLSMAAGLVVIFTLGTLHLAAISGMGVSNAFSAGFLMFTWWDLLKLGAASTIFYELSKRWPVLPPRG